MSGAVERGDRVVVTGAAGFIGSAVVRALLARGASVTAVIEPGANTADPALRGADAVVVADVAQPGALDAALEGARYCVHTAARYAFWPRDPEHFYTTNVEGSRNVVGAAWRAGVERVCYTSSVATIGLQRTEAGGAAVEDDYAHVEHLFGNYKRSKYVAEHEVLRLAAQGAPVVLTQPTFPVGPGDRRPTPTGKLVLDFLNGRFPGYVDTTLNVVHVDDLAEGHVLALEQGRQGTSYILGGDNLALREMLALLAELTGLRAPTLRVPAAVSVLAARVSDVVEARLLRREPHVPLEGAQMAATQMRYDDARARGELGYASRPARDALSDAVGYFVEEGYVERARASAIRLARRD
ncbi:MAG TPA: hopanoid-associated sugar epimerase [Acidimicrobiales bacterium]|nr:hopanoid-associated sugar epimerase [Acidimicrobiales bacterium]